eukprot:SM000022S07259  [mRNA]  locus=s22:828111:828740:- [translate_table: standard]
MQAQHCYCRLLERMVAVWAYHSGKRLVLVDTTTGAMTEQHLLAEREGQRRWRRFFARSLLKVCRHCHLPRYCSFQAGVAIRIAAADTTEGHVEQEMDEARAEEADVAKPERHWIWPHTGDIVWAGLAEKERLARQREKADKARRQKERLARMRRRYKQKALGRVSRKKPLPGPPQPPAVPSSPAWPVQAVPDSELRGESEDPPFDLATE